MKGFNAMFRFAYANQNNAAASAMCAEAASSCTSQSSRFNCIALGAIIMASIIIYGLAILLNLRLIALLVILAAIVGLVRLVHCKTDTPWCYELAV